MRRIGLFVVLAAIGASAAAQAQTERARQYTAASGEEVRIGRHAMLDRRCQPRQMPVVRVLQPPQHGTISTRQGAYVMQQSLGSVNCNGREAAGTLIFYRSAPGYHGADTMQYAVDVGAQPVLNTVTVIVQ